MNKPNFKGLAKSLKQGVDKYSPQILIGVGIAGMLTTTVLAVKATPKALKLIEEEKASKYDQLVQDGEVNGTDYPHSKSEVKLTPVEVVKTAWKPYIPAVVTGTLSTVCLIGSCGVSARRAAALATAYQIAETSINEYKEAVIETIGEKKEKSVRKKAAENKIKKNPVVSEDQVLITERGNTLCYDTLSGRYFKSDIEAIKKAENELNYALLNEDYISLNSFYNMIGMKDIKTGGDIGWNISKDGKVELDLSAQLADDGTPCIVVDYDPMPKYNYWRWD